MVLLAAAFQFYQHCLLKMLFLNAFCWSLFQTSDGSIEVWVCLWVLSSAALTLGLFGWQYHAIFTDVNYMLELDI